MHAFWNLEEIIPRVLAKGVTAKVATGEKMMLSLVTLAPGAVVPTHSHPHEQMGFMVSGTMEFTIEGETRVFSGNEMYFVPGGVPHSAKGGPGGAVALDAFTPPREEYR
jgi:quercetin dioxygenase-like cupin family protein